MKSPNITGIILAGGKSTRIGYNKSFLKIGECYLIDRVIDILSQFTSSVLIVTNEDQFDLVKTHTLRARVLEDICPGKGPLGGIYTGLFYAENAQSLVVGCDMPFLNSDLINYLIDRAADFDTVVPRIGNMIEPLHAVYSKNCMPSIESLIHAGKLQISKLFDLVDTKYVMESEINMFDPDHLSFLNINTESDLTKAKLLIRHVDGKRIDNKDGSFIVK